MVTSGVVEEMMRKRTITFTQGRKGRDSGKVQKKIILDLSLDKRVGIC